MDSGPMNFFTLFHWGLTYIMVYQIPGNIFSLPFENPFWKLHLASESQMPPPCSAIVESPDWYSQPYACNVSRKHRSIVASLLNWSSLQSRANTNVIKMLSLSATMYLLILGVSIGLPRTHSQVMFSRVLHNKSILFHESFGPSLSTVAPQSFHLHGIYC